MPADIRKLRPGELCQFLNSTPLGEVIDEGKLRRHRTKAGLQIGDGRRVDLLRYVAWLVHVRHAPPTVSAKEPAMPFNLAEAAQAAAVVAGKLKPKQGEGRTLTPKQVALIAALLSEPGYGRQSISYQC